MIVYETSGPFGGLNKMQRVHGSAVYKVVIPSAVSVGILIAYEYILFGGQTNIEQSKVIKDSYAIGAFVVFFRYATYVDRHVRTLAILYCARRKRQIESH